MENTESGNVFTVEAGNAIALDADVKLSVLDKAEAMIDPRAKPKPRWTAGFHRTREVRDAVANLQRILGIAEDGLVGRHTVDAVKLLADAWPSADARNSPSFCGVFPNPAGRNGT